MTMPIRSERDGTVVRLVLDRPKNYNALSSEMIAALDRQLAAIAGDDSIRVAIIAAEGKAFSAGHDLKEMQAARDDADRGDGAYRRLFADCATMMQRVANLPQPVIAEVQGVATAAGCQLVASCDLVVASEAARFGVNGVDLGLFCSTPMVALTRAIAPRQAFELLVTGDFVSAIRAQELGLVNHVVPVGELTRTTLSLAHKIAAKLPAAVQMGKRAFRQQNGMPLAEAYAMTGEVIRENLMREDTAEGIAAFLEKRPPNWS